ncbi:response regulator transcription factor [Streptomyces sp. RKND-216]|nr:response regulator transcription factor [Streptomyces sp. RKND-216]
MRPFGVVKAVKAFPLAFPPRWRRWCRCRQVGSAGRCCWWVSLVGGADPSTPPRGVHKPRTCFFTCAWRSVAIRGATDRQLAGGRPPTGWRRQPSGGYAVRVWASDWAAAEAPGGGAGRGDPLGVRPSSPCTASPRRRPAPAYGSDCLPAAARTRCETGHIGWSSGAPSRSVFGTSLTVRYEFPRYAVSSTAETAATLRLLIVDDEVLIRSGLTVILGSAPDIEVVGSCAGADALTAVREHRPDVVLLDIRMPDVDGITLLRHIRRLPEPPHVAMLTTFDTDEYLGEALALGAGGFLLKDTDPEVLVRSVRALGTGAGCMSSSVVRRLRDGGRGGEAVSADRAVAELSGREKQVLTFIGEGLSNGEIGARMCFSTATAKDDVSAVLTKLGVANRVQAAVIAERAGLLGADGA